MKKMLFFLLLLPWQLLYADCDLSRFRWECDIPIYPKPTRHAHALVYCGNSYGYVTQAHYNILVCYHRRSVNMVLRRNGEFVEAPCIPDERFDKQIRW